jgi:hypothetical protein
MKLCSASSVIRGMQIKITMRYHHKPNGWVNLKTMVIPHPVEAMEKPDHSCIACGTAKRYSRSAKLFDSFFKKLNIGWGAVAHACNPTHSRGMIGSLSEVRSGKKLARHFHPPHCPSQQVSKAWLCTLGILGMWGGIGRRIMVRGLSLAKM